MRTPSRTRRSARRLTLATLLVLVAALVSSCTTKATLAILVSPDGSGSVTVTAKLDAEATRGLGSDPKAALALDDLAAAGWKVTVDGPNDSGLVVTARKPFARPEQLEPILSEVGGEGDQAVFPGWKLSVTDGFGATTYQLDGKVRLSGSFDQFSDAQVAAALDGFATGRSPEELAAEMAEHPDAFGLEVSARMPGDIEQAVGLKVAEDSADTATRSFPVGAGTPAKADVQLTAERSESTATLLFLLAGVALVGGVALLILRRLQPAGKHRRTRRPPAST